MNAAPVRIPRVKPPDKKKYEEDMEVLSNTIKAKENQLVSFSYDMVTKYSVGTYSVNRPLGRFL